MSIKYVTIQEFFIFFHQVDIHLIETFIHFYGGAFRYG